MMSEKDALKTLAMIQTPYETETPAFCYPGTPLNGDTGDVAKIIMPKNINMIGSHTIGVTSNSKTIPPAEGGFEQPHQIERDYIKWIGKYFCKHVDPNKVLDIIDGFFCGGGTEGNLEGMWIAREYLRSKHNGPIALMFTSLTHYSGPKTAFILNINKHIHYVKLNEKLEMDPEDLFLQIKQLSGEIKNFIILAAVGTTLCGSVDNIVEIDKKISILEKDFGVNIYLHVDQAFGGFVLPFISNIPVGFENKNVKSISLDGHKMGNIPYPSGIFMCRKDLQMYVKIDVPYVGSHMDATISGSRTFLGAAYGWFYAMTKGDKYHTQIVKDCISHRDELAAMIKNIKGVNVLPYSPYINILPFAIPEDNIKKMPLGYQIRSDKMGDMNVCKLCILPHTFKYIKQFAKDLENAMN